MWRALRYSIAAALLALGAYGAKGWYDAGQMAPEMAQRADALIAAGFGPDDLGADRLNWLLMVEDPGFADHDGLDVLTDGGGITTITQSLAKRVAFDNFQPGLRKLRQTTFAMSLERHLTKPQIMALWLDTLSMGRGPDGWITGFFAASDTFFGGAPAEIAEDEFITLIAVLIAPADLKLAAPDAALLERASRIQRLIRQDCTPNDNADVWLDGCAT